MTTANTDERYLLVEIARRLEVDFGQQTAFWEQDRGARQNSRINYHESRLAAPVNAMQNFPACPSVSDSTGIAAHRMDYACSQIVPQAPSPQIAVEILLLKRFKLSKEGAI